ncbi:MAG TPA: hypothetical protein VK778_11905 [Solirubrobacteraceae bacterium]|jgi:hypothetical protein|nr:hypothetical protein [Solirubrobacteraceae bacterium]
MSSLSSVAGPQALDTRRLAARLRVTTRGIQIVLGVVWLLDGLFQFKSFMFTHGIVSEVFAPAAAKQWSIVGGPMRTFDAFYGRDLTLWNTLSGQIQVAIGLALIVSRKTVKPALLASFGWALVVWWFGEGFGGLTSTTLPAPLMGAPGAVIVYAIIGLLVWPTSRQTGRSPAALGPLGDRGGLYFWSGLWALSAGLWLVNVNRAQDATQEMIKGMAEASPHWLATFQNSIASDAHGHGTAIAVVLAILSVAVAVGVWTPLRWPALVIGIVLSLAYWVLGQSLGGPFWTEGATDFNAGPLFVLLAFALFPVVQANDSTPGEGTASRSSTYLPSTSTSATP